MFYRGKAGSWVTIYTCLPAASTGPSPTITQPPPFGFLNLFFHMIYKLYDFGTCNIVTSRVKESHLFALLLSIVQT